VFEAELELGHRPGGIGQRDDRHGEDPSLGAEAPLVEDPAIQSVEQAVGEVDVVGHLVLDPRDHGREHPARLDALGVHALEPGRPVHVLGPSLQRLEDVDALLCQLLATLAPAEHQLHRARHGDRVERGVGDVGPELAVEDDVGAAALVGHPQELAGEARVEVPGERITALVEVVVGVEHAVAEIPGHDSAP
jgi:hypothetical protein